MVSAFFTGQIIKKTEFILVNQITQCLIKPLFNDIIYTQSTHYLRKHIVPTLCTGQIMKQPICALVKQLSQCVCISHSSITKCNPNEHSNLSNTKSIF